MPLLPGDPAPDFIAPSPANARFSFGSTAGRYIVLAFLDSLKSPATQAIMGAVRAQRGVFNDEHACFFGVVSDPGEFAELRNQVPGIRWFLDADRTIAELYGTRAKDGSEQPHAVLLDPTMRIHSLAGPAGCEAMFATIPGLPPAGRLSATSVPPPVLVLPRIFEPDFCASLIAYYGRTGGKPSGVAKEIDGTTVVKDSPGQKKRRDAEITDQALIAGARGRIHRRLVPQVHKVFQFNATRIERHIVCCYDSTEGGFFRPHRDNTTKGTAHRRFAVTINLNADDYEGGDLRFPEFGSQTFRAPTGGAVVFSCSLLHEATPVTAGRRFAYLPFLYDEEAAKIREANAQFLDPELQGYRNAPLNLPTGR